MCRESSVKFWKQKLRARSFVVRTQGLNSKVTRQSKASMQNEGFAAPKSSLAQRRHTTAPKKRTQNPTQKVNEPGTRAGCSQTIRKPGHFTALKFSSRRSEASKPSPPPPLRFYLQPPHPTPTPLILIGKARFFFPPARKF
ncbi:hypothetical protein M0804_003565 [Polistes exclamans]|nr:hypothetical protein M0804_003565 [Polistes exclamans]